MLTSSTKDFQFKNHFPTVQKKFLLSCLTILQSTFHLFSTLKQASAEDCKTSHSEAQKAHITRLFYSSILCHKRGYPFHKPQSKAPCFYSCLLACMSGDWQKADPNILERKTEIREAAQTPPTLSHLSSSQCSRNAHIQSWLEHLSDSKCFRLNVWMLC